MKPSPKDSVPPPSYVLREIDKLEPNCARVTHLMLSKFPPGSAFAENLLTDLPQEHLRLRFVYYSFRGEVATAHSELIQELIQEATQKGECDIEIESLRQAEVEKVIETILGMYILAITNARHSQIPSMSEKNDEEHHKKTGWRERIKRLFTRSS